MLLPQTHSPEVDYSLFIMDTVEMSMEKKETSPAALRRSFPPPICSLLQPPGLCFLFLSCGGSPFEERRGALYIGFFRSQGSFGKKDRRKRGHEAQKRWAHAARYRGRMGHPLLALRPPFACFLCSEVFLLPKKNDHRKFAAHYDVFKALK